MNTSDLLEQLLRGGMTGMNRPNGGVPQGGGGDLGGLLGGLLGGGAGGGAGLGGLLGGLLGGGSALGGSTRGRSGGGTNYAALASLGMMAFQAYQAWQRSQAAAPQQAQQALRTADLLAGPDVESHSHAVLRALIAAAKADGRIDAAEKQMIGTEIGRHTDDPQLQKWLDDEVARPLDAADVARSATDPAIAAEMYLASVMLIDDQQDAERNYLDELAAALQIDPQLQLHLEQQARGGAA